MIAGYLSKGLQKNLINPWINVDVHFLCYFLKYTGAAGFEPAARDLEGRYSIQLSYAPNY